MTGLRPLESRLLLALAAAAVSATAVGNPLPRVEVFEPVARSRYTVSRTFTGVVEAAQQVALGFERDGRIVAIDVDEGGRVPAGARVASIDTARLEARKDELDAGLEEVAARLTAANATLARLRDAVQYEGAPARELDEAKGRVGALTARAAGLDAERRTIAVELEKSELRAPFAAVVAARHLDVGAVIGVGQPVLELLQAGPLEVRVGVPARFLSRLAVGDLATVRIEEAPVRGRIARIAPRRREVDRTVDVVLTVPEGSGRPGDLARLEVSVAQQGEGFWIPLSALMSGLRGAWQVYETVPTDTADVFRIVPRAASVIAHGSDAVFVRASLAPGTRLVASGRHRVVPGQTVRIVPIRDGGA